MLGSSRPEVIFFMISQKRKHYFKSNNNCKSKENMCTSLNWSFRSAAYFIKNYPQQSFVNFRFHRFPCRFFKLIKNRFQYV